MIRLTEVIHKCSFNRLLYPTLLPVLPEYSFYGKCLPLFYYTVCPLVPVLLLSSFHLYLGLFQFNYFLKPSTQISIEFEGFFNKKLYLLASPSKSISKLLNLP